MSDFEKEYYESEGFWEGGMLSDETNMSRFNQTSSLIPDDVKTLVDVGCGNGVFVNSLLKSKPGLDVYAVDRSKKALEFVKAKKENAEITNLPFDDNFFDCVTCLEVLEHLTIQDFQTALKELCRISRKYLIISVPYNEKLEESHTKCPSCKSIFNFELHLRNFDDELFKNLFKDLGYENVHSVKLGKMVNFKGHSVYKKMFYPEQLLKWNSPVCPLCGYKEISNPHSPVSQVPEKRQITTKQKIFSLLSWLPKIIWPKEERYYWIMGLYKRIE